ncbi:MAG: GNAT family N-acetyltransferase [Oscillospiraceae bacterium]|jgi:ribosomal-protein-alanine N-acetyltransferase|nr:GNAT family N-acetyltransferase [Oscillospiraceae bacterium]
MDDDVINAVREIETACFDKPWSVAAIAAAVQNETAIFFAESYGYIIGMKLGGDCELFRVAVLPEFRGRGNADRLMRKFLEKCEGNVFLEVASKNIPALNLYKKFGFTEISRRKNYYGDDDGLVMRYEGLSGKPLP